MPEQLTPQQISFYEENGYLVIENQIHKAWLAQIRAERSRFEEEATELEYSNDRLDLEDSHTRATPRLRRIKLPHMISIIFDELMLFNHILGPARDLIGPDLRLHASKLNMKSAG